MFIGVIAVNYVSCLLHAPPYSHCPSCGGGMMNGLLGTKCCLRELFRMIGRKNVLHVCSSCFMPSLKPKKFFTNEPRLSRVCCGNGWSIVCTVSRSLTCAILCQTHDGFHNFFVMLHES